MKKNRNSFIYNVSLLAGGTAGAQLLSILASPFLTRLYSPAEIGVLSIFGSIAAICSAVSCLRYEMAIPITKNDTDAVSLLLLCILLILSTSICVFLLTIILKNTTECYRNIILFEKFIFLVPIAMFLSGLNSALTTFAIRKREFATISRTRLIQSVVVIGIQISYSNYGVNALIGGLLTAQLIGTMFLFSKILPVKTVRKTKITNLKHLAYEHKNFALFSMPESLCNVAGVQLPYILIGNLFNSSATGLYALTVKILQLPTSLISSAVGGVFHADVAKLYRNKQLSQMVEKLLLQLIQIAMTPCLILVLLGPSLFHITFGDKWLLAGEFSRWMAPWIFLVFITSPLTTLFGVLNKQKQGFLFQGILVILRVVSIIIGYALNNLLTAIIAFSLFSAFVWAAQLVYVLNLTQIPFIKMFRSFLLELGMGIAFITPIGFCALLLDVPEIILLAVVIITIASHLLTNFYIRKINFNN